MPWLLSSSGDQRYVDWAPCTAEWTSTSAGKAGDDSYVHDPAGPDLRYRQDSKHRVLPDLMCGNPSGTYFVSQRLRALIEEMEPFKHRYIPLIVRTHDLRVLEGEFFLFKFGTYIDDGIIAEKSRAVLMGKHEETKFYSTPAHPKITWRAGAINGHHFFTDKYLRKRVLVSDEFLKRMKREKLLTSLKVVQSYSE